ncbi:hypothetical protein [Streptomyces sp. UNOC14_S4]|uniref:hypothetical protein n=1 Tax=Streptomyces sp. UNOC14_S4 TaxID=2872340 RepID=UPI001E2E15DD|nr:hypothetical protein [Streptomyces sp. UNOC14_S4]MCC3769609.1 hypothetical protein [Streptomyces sp. UNOC14_S4]
MLIPPMMPPDFIPLPHSAGPPAVPTKKWQPPCVTCAELVAALQSAWRQDLPDSAMAVRREIVAHFDAAHPA